MTMQQYAASCYHLQKGVHYALLPPVTQRLYYSEWWNQQQGLLNCTTIRVISICRNHRIHQRKLQWFYE